MPTHWSFSHKAGTFWTMDLASSPPTPASPRVPIVFEHASPESANDLAGISDGDAESIRQRFTENRRCYLGRVEAEPAVYGWASFDHEEVGEMGLHLRLQPGEGYIWDCVTAPPFRRQGLYTALLHHIACDLRAEGLQRLWIGADFDKGASQKGMASAGFQHAADLHIYQAFGWRLLWSPAAPGAAPQQANDARRVMLGEPPRVVILERAPA